LAIDIGATKTLVAVFSAEGKILQRHKIKTARRYSDFLDELGGILGLDEFKDTGYTAVCCAIPGKVDHSDGSGINFGNLEWYDVPIAKDISRLTGRQVLVENDAKLAGLYQAVTHRKYKKLLYLTLSTGVGSGFIVEGKIDPELDDSEAGRMVLEHEGTLKKWEEFASGKALFERFGKKAEQLDNPFAWKAYAKDVARGLEALLAVLQPDAVVIGGSVGAHLEKFEEPLKRELMKNADKMVAIPPIIKAVKAEEAVVYGCYEYIKQKLS
jgi:predicted NBD/HSP70 family sugar kinase